MGNNHNAGEKKSFFIDFSLRNLKETFFSKTGKDAGKIFSANMIATAIGLITSLITLRIFSTNEIGILAATNNLIGIVSGIILSGFNISFIRYLSDYLVKDKAIAKQLTKKIFQYEFIFASLALIIILFFSSVIANNIFHKSELEYFIKLAAISIFLGVLISFFKTYFQSIEKFNFISITIIAQAILSISSIILFAYLDILTPENVMYINITLVSIFLGISTIYYNKHKIVAPKLTQLPNNFLSSFFSYSKWVVLMALTTLLFSKLDIFMLTSMVELDQVAMYSYGFTIYSTYLIVLSSINLVLFPKISALQTVIDSYNSAKKILKFSIAVAIGIIPTIFFVKPVTELLFDDKFINSYPIIYILFISFIFSLILNPVVNFLLVIKKQKFLSLLTLVFLVLNVIGNLIFIPLYGIIGAVCVTAFTYIFANVISFIKVWKVFKLNMENSISEISNKE